MTTRPDNLPLAIGVMIFNVFCLSLGDALIKQMSVGFGLWQMFALRSLLVLPVVIVATLVLARRQFWPRRVGWVTLRSVMLVGAWVFYYAALPFMSFAVAASVLYTLPIFITLFSAIWLGETLTRNGVIAAALGFLGVVVILRPDTSGVDLAALLPLGSAILYALTMVLSRAKCRDEHPLVMAMALNLTFIAYGIVGFVLIPTASSGGFLNAEWVGMGGAEWQAMALLGLSILVGSIATAFAYQNGPASVLGIFDFGYVGFAVLWGLLFFGDVPDAVTALGIALIIASGVISTRKA